MPRMKRIIIADVRSYLIDGTIKGHGYAVASNYLDVFRGAAEVKVAGGPAYCRQYGEDSVALPYDTDEAAPSWLNKLRILLNARRLFRLCSDDTIIIQSSGVVTALMGIIMFKRPQTRVFMILYNEDALKSCFKRFIFRLARAKIAGVLCPSKRVGAAYGLPYCVVPDYIYCGGASSDKTRAIPYEKKQYDFCTVGLIWRDKGMVEVARRLAGKPCKVLIAGALSGEVGLEEDLKAACRGAENIELRLGYLSAEEYDAAVRQSRYCILNYSGAYSEHSSGVVYDILFRGVPVIGRACKALQFIDEFRVGCTFRDVSEFDPQRVLQEPVHTDYCRHLEAYYASHQTFREKVVQFISGVANNTESYTEKQ